MLGWRNEAFFQATSGLWHDAHALPKWLDGGLWHEAQEPSAGCVNLHDEPFWRWQVEHWPER